MKINLKFRKFLAISLVSVLSSSLITTTYYSKNTDLNFNQSNLNFVLTKDNNLIISDIQVIVNNQKIKASIVNHETYIFLPSSADLTNIKFEFNSTNNVKVWYDNGLNIDQLISGNSLNILESSNYDEEKNTYDFTYRVSRPVPNSDALEYSQSVIHFMKSENIAAMYLNVGNSAYSRQWIESSTTHTNDATKYTNVSMHLEDENSIVIYDGALNQLKGRGNSTWEYVKKPYQIKVEQKTDLLSTNNQNENKTWILLANAYDQTLLRNAIGLDLAKYLGLEETPEYRFVDLYFDGEYRGNYMLCEKVQIGKGRIDIASLDKHNTVEDKTAIAQDVNKFGLTYQYNPTAICDTDDISGGYLLEIDKGYYKGENSWFQANENTTVVIKSPEHATKEQVKYISEYFSEMFTALQNDSYEDKSVNDYIDINSLAALYTVNQYLKNADFFWSSTYFFLPEINNENYEHKFYAGPAWDFDTSIGYRTDLEGLRDSQTLWLGHEYDYFQRPIIRNAIKKQAKKIDKLDKILFASDVRYNKEIDFSPLNMYKDYIKASQKMNFILWPFSHSNTITYETYDENYDYVYNFLKERHEAILPSIAQWDTHMPFTQHFKNLFISVKHLKK